MAAVDSPEARSVARLLYDWDLVELADAVNDAEVWTQPNEELGLLDSYWAEWYADVYARVKVGIHYFDAMTPGEFHALEEATELVVGSLSDLSRSTMPPTSSRGRSRVASRRRTWVLFLTRALQSARSPN